jgi:uncharacterized RDD family membrane protein YckC
VRPAPSAVDDAPPSGSGSQVDAPLVRRLAALAYEVLLYAALTLVVGFLTIPLLPPAAPGAIGLRIPDLPARVLSFALVFGAGGAYYVGCWTGGRQTLPMKTWQLRLVRENGAAVDRRTALVRYLAAWIGPGLALLAFVWLRSSGLGFHAIWLFALNFAWAFVDPGRRFLHDRIAGTRIIRAVGSSGSSGAKG